MMLSWLAHVSVIFKYWCFIQAAFRGVKEKQIGTAADHHNKNKNISIILQSPIWGFFILEYLKKSGWSLYG